MRHENEIINKNNILVWIWVLLLNDYIYDEQQ